MNAIGIDVTGLDVPAFLAWARALFPAVAGAWLGLLLVLRRPSWLLAFVVAANAYAWAVTNYPLQRMYALGASNDRVGNVALCQVVAAGNSPLETAQVGQLHFEPFWSLFVAALSGWDPERVLRLYPFLSLAMACAFPIALYCGLGGGGLSPWARALAAGGATLFSAVPGDHAALFRVPWAMTFLLKPNHALGLVLFPIVLRAFAAIRSTRGRIAVGVLLHLLGWVFVLHMVYVACGLVAFAAASLLLRREEARRDVLDVAVVLAVNAAVVSPYLVMLVAGYPFLEPSPRMTVPDVGAHLRAVTRDVWWLLPPAAWGAVAAARQGGRVGRLFAAQLAGAFLAWLAYVGLGELHLARERDELFYWIRFLLGASAGVGVWDALTRVLSRVIPAPASPTPESPERKRRREVPTAVRPRPLAPAALAAGLALAVTPWALPAWWDPARMDRYFAESRAPFPESLTLPTDFVRTNTESRAVLAGDADFARFAAALGARRALLVKNLHRPKDYVARKALEGALVTGTGDASAVRAEAERYGVRYLVVTPRLLALEYPQVSLAALLRRPHLRLVHLSGDSAGRGTGIFRLQAPGDLLGPPALRIDEGKAVAWWEGLVRRPAPEAAGS